MATSGDTCPLCSEGTLKAHCPSSKTCAWTKCPACKSTLDVDRHRGLTADNKAIRLG